MKIGSKALVRSVERKLAKLTPRLRAKIVRGERKYMENPASPVSNYLVGTKLHCNGGKMVDAGLFLREHCEAGGKIFVTLAGAASTFQIGKAGLCDLIRERKIAAICATGANMEESLYRLAANGCYAYIPNYSELTREEELQLDHAGLRRITDTFLPEDESVRVILPELVKLWLKAEREGKDFLWHEYFFQLFDKWLLPEDDSLPLVDCWLYQAWKFSIPVFVPGFEDSTMGNIFAYYTYHGDHSVLRKYKQKKPLALNVVRPGIAYMHVLAEWYLNNTKKHGLAFLQLGGGIAGDFPICVVPHLKKDFLYRLSIMMQEKLIRAWAGFIEIHSSPMSYGSYAGAGGKEKITWGKLTVSAYFVQICGDFTAHFPDIAALVLRR